MRHEPTSAVTPAHPVRMLARASLLLGFSLLLGYSPLVRLLGRALADVLVLCGLLVGVVLALVALWRGRALPRTGLLVSGTGGLLVHGFALATFASNFFHLAWATTLLACILAVALVVGVIRFAGREERLKLAASGSASQT